MRRSVFLAAALLSGACVTGSVPPSTTEPLPSTTSTPASLPAPATTEVSPVFPVPVTGEAEGWPIGGVADVVPGALLRVEGACVTAEADGHRYLVMWAWFLAELATIIGDRVVMEADWLEEGSVRSLVSGERYHLRGVVDDPLVVPAIADGVCEYDSTLVLAGAVPASDSDRFENFPTYGSSRNFTQPGWPPTGWPVSIDGACVTVEIGNYGTALIVWPVGSVALMPDGRIHYSFWEYFIDTTISDGDFVNARVYTDFAPRDPEQVWIVNQPPTHCEYDDLAFIDITLVHRPNEAEVFELPDRVDFDGIEAALFRGAEHCDWHPTWFIHVRSEDLIGPFTPVRADHLFIRDPSVVPQNVYAADADIDRELPPNAELIGTSPDGYELWYAHSDSSYIYLRSQDQIEAWVRVVNWALCA